MISGLHGRCLALRLKNEYIPMQHDWPEKGQIYFLYAPIGAPYCYLPKKRAEKYGIS
jgi:hypothetical protein